MTDENILHTITQVKRASSEQEANKYLQQGWILLSVVSYDDPESGGCVRYSLGRPPQPQPAEDCSQKQW